MIPNPAHPPLRDLRILVVDDDEVDCRAVAKAIADSDLEARVDAEASLSGARRAIQGELFSCVILDDHLRDGRASQLLQEGRAGMLRLPPVIILTGSGNDRVAVELMKTGASDYLPKDELTPSRIAQSVRNALRIREGQDALRRAYEELEARVVERTAELEQESANRREAEEQARRHLGQLAHVARLSTLGEMAAGLAHELNQPLGAIVNYANGCLRRLESGPVDPATLQEALAHIAAQGERAGKIIHRLRSFLANQGPQLFLADLNQLLREVAALEQPDARQRDTVFEFDLAENLPLIRADAIQIQQVALNLMRNGIEAMQSIPPEERRLSIRTRARGAGQVEAAIEDCGSGCESGALERMFEPFYSTKEKGMGMGLAISRSIIEAHGGKLDATRGAERGLCFRFILTAEEAA